MNRSATSLPRAQDKNAMELLTANFGPFSVFLFLRQSAHCSKQLKYIYVVAERKCVELIP